MCRTKTIRANIWLGSLNFDIHWDTQRVVHLKNLQANLFSLITAHHNTRSTRFSCFDFFYFKPSAALNDFRKELHQSNHAKNFSEVEKDCDRIQELNKTPRCIFLMFFCYVFQIKMYFSFWTRIRK